MLSAVGPESLVVNHYGATTEFNGSVATDSSGDFVVVWTENGPSPGGAVYAQRYNAEGVAQGTAIPVASSADFMSGAQVAMDDDGGFVVTFVERHTSRVEVDTNRIFAVRYSSAGRVVGGALVNPDGVGTGDSAARVAVDADGDFVVTWTRRTASDVGVMALRFNSLGVAQGDPFQVFTSATTDQLNSSVASDDAGDFVVAWALTGINPDTSPGAPEFVSAISARLYDSSGVSQGTTTPISSTGSSPIQPAVAMDADGDFVIAWSGYNTAGNDAEVFAQRYNLAGIAQGSTITVNTDPTGTNLTQPTIAMDDGGEFVVAWTDSGPATNPSDVFGQRFSSAGIALGSEFPINTTKEYNQYAPSVALSADGNFVIAWTSNTDPNGGFASNKVFFQRYLGDVPPVLTGIEPYPLTYSPGSAATPVTGSLILSDVDDTNLEGAVIQISDGMQAGDVLTFTNTANITGVFNAGTLTLTGTDTVANYQAALRSVTYSSSSPDPSARTLTIQVSDGEESSNLVQRSVGGLIQLVGTTLSVYGTLQDDVITVSEGVNLIVNIDGVVQQFTPAQVTAIVIYGNDGNDSITINSLAAGTALTVTGENGNDSINVSGSVTNNVVLDGGSGNDLLLAGSGNDTLTGGIGNDWLNGGTGNDNLTGGSGDDVYSFSDTPTNEIDKVFEQIGQSEGLDLLDFSAITSAVTVNLISDSALAGMGHRIVQAGAAGQALNFENVNGGSANDFITGNGSNNYLNGNGGNDTLKGFDGSDHLVGGSGNDLIFGGNQDDLLIGGIGDDYLIGEAGNDQLEGDDGYNSLVGGTGNDAYLFTDSAVNHIDTVTELSAEGTDTLNFAAVTIAVNANLTSDTLASTSHVLVVTAASGQSANFENVIGGMSNDQIFGNASNNLLTGGNGNDTISGGGGNDILVGDAGNDTLKGISGRNILIGGTGGDLMLGGTDDDVLVADSTIYDSNPLILNVLLTEWVSANTYEDRAHHLGGVPGGANQGWYLNSSTIIDDHAVDYLTGGDGQDFFLAYSNGDVVTDVQANEFFAS